MDILEKIDKAVKDNPVIIFMKGSPQLPQCGYSSRAAQALAACGQEFARLHGCVLRGGGNDGSRGIVVKNIIFIRLYHHPNDAGHRAHRRGAWSRCDGSAQGVIVRCTRELTL